MSLFKSLFHVSIFCNDIEKSLEFYKGLGCEYMFDMVDKDGTIPWNYYLKLCEGQYIELQPCKSDNPHPHPEESTYYANQAVWHFALETDNMVEMIEKLHENGIKIFSSPEADAIEVKTIDDVVFSPYGCFGCWVFDPDGTPIELMEQSKHSMQRLAELRLLKEKKAGNHEEVL